METKQVICTLPVHSSLVFLKFSSHCHSPLNIFFLCLPFLQWSCNATDTLHIYLCTISIAMFYIYKKHRVLLPLPRNNFAPLTNEPNWLKHISCLKMHNLLLCDQLTHLWLEKLSPSCLPVEFYTIFITMLITLKTFIKQQGSIPFWKHYSCFSEKMLSTFSQLQIVFHLLALLLYVCSWLRFSKRSRTNLSCPCPSALLWSHSWWKPCPFHSQLFSPSGLTCPSAIAPQGQGSTGIKKEGQSKKTTQLRQWWLAADTGPLSQEDKRELLGLGDWKYLVYLKMAATTQLLWPYDQEKGQLGVARSFYCSKEKPETWNFTWLLNIDRLFRPNKIGLWVGLSHWILIFELSFRYFFPPQTNPFWTVFFLKT